MYEYLTQIESYYPGVTGYSVTNGTNVAANDHNTLLADVRGLSSGGSFGNGKHGRFAVGAISNPVVTDVPTLQLAGSGSLTATLKYRYRYGNMSGVTLATNAGASIVASANQVRVLVPGAASDSNIGYCAVERSHDGGTTWFHIATVPIPDATAAWQFIDNNPITSGTNLGASNTTSLNATVAGGVYQFTNDIVWGGSTTLTISDDNTKGAGGIVIFKTLGGATLTGGTVNGTGKFVRTSGPDCGFSLLFDSNTLARLASFSTGTGGAPGCNATLTTFPFSSTLGYREDSPSSGSTCFGASIIYNLNRQGTGGQWTTSTDRAGAGATFAILAAGPIVSSATINCLGLAGSTASSGEPGRGGGAGGTIYFGSGTSITHTGIRNTAGGAGSNAVTDGSGFTAYGGGGGGAGAIIDDAPIVIDTGTNTIGGGAAGSSVSCTSTNRAGGSGGANVGNGGYSGRSSVAAGGAGIKLTFLDGSSLARWAA